MTDTIRAYSQRLLPPYSGQLQIAESERARAITMDCETWEIHFLHADVGGERKFRRAALSRNALSPFSMPPWTICRLAIGRASKVVMSPTR